MLGEFDIIRHYFSRDRDGSGVVVGVGDDGPVFRQGTPASGQTLRTRFSRIARLLGELDRAGLLA